MALFEKPYRIPARSDSPDAVSSADVAVVDAVVAIDPDPAPLAAGVQEPAAAPIARVEPTASIPVTPAEPVPSIEPVTPIAPVTSVDPAPVTAPARMTIETSNESSAPAGLVSAGDAGLRPAGESHLVEFSRMVPRESKSSPVRDNQRLVTAIDDADPVLDQLRSLAASLHQARSGRELKVIAVTSSVSGEGKTLLAANLALTLSRSYMRQVLMIDADLRRPNLHRVFGTPSGDGIRSAIESVRDGRPVSVQEVAPRLALLPAGKPVRDPISVLASDAMQRLLAGANQAFDWIVIDTPPVGMLPDVGLLSSLSDAVLLVVEAGRVRFDLVQRTVESVGADRIFGVVLNKVPEQDIVAAYGMHYYAPYR